MPLPVWPAGLPQVPLAGAGSQAPFQAPTETEMEDGPPRARRTATASWTAISVRYVMDAGQFAVLEAFVRDTLGHGAGRFLIPRWRPGATAPLPLKQARIPGGVYAWQASGPRVFVTLPLSILDY